MMESPAPLEPHTPEPSARGDRHARARRALTIGLGVLWLLDAALQYQPFMFTTGFPNTITRPTGDGSPAWVRAPVDWAASLMASHVVLLNAVFASVQLAIAVGLLWRRTARAALAASIGWAVLVWWLGEGLGGLFAGPVSPLMGLPGAVIVYAVLAVIAWPPRAPRVGRSLAESSVLGRSGARALWLVFWALFVFETLRPADRAPNGLADAVSGMSDGEPHWIGHLDAAAGRLLAGHGVEASVALAVLFAVIAVAVLLPATAARGALVLAVVLAGLIWVIGENFGGLFTGQGTDPNSGPLLALLAVAYWPFTSRARAAVQHRKVTPLPQGA